VGGLISTLPDGPAALSLLAEGIAAGSALFLLASGLTLVFGITRVVNFAHGSLYMLGAYVGWTLLAAGVLPRTPGGLALGALAASLIVAALGAALEAGLLRRLYGVPELFQLLATFAVLLIAQDATLALWGPADRTLARPPWMRAAWRLGEARVPVFDAVLAATALAVLVGLWLLTTRTRWGMLARATAENRAMAAALGIGQRRLFLSTFALGAGLAGLAGVLSLPGGSANLQMDLPAVTDAFVVVVVGGLGSVRGAYLASLALGLLRAFGLAVIPGSTLVLTFAVMAAVLAVRPRGLLGTQAAEARAPASHATIRPASARTLAAGAAVLAAAALAPLAVGPFWLSVLTEAAIALLFAASLHVMMGPGGMPSFGHAAWFGIGAYAAALAARDLSAPMPAALTLAPIVAGCAALLFGRLVGRLSGVYLAMLTLAVAQIVWAGAVQWVGLTGGDNGVLGVWPPGIVARPAVFYWLALALGAGGALLLRRALFAPFGLALRAARDAPARAEASGLDTAGLRAAAIGLSGAAAGLAGALFAFEKGSVFPGYAGIGRSVDALLMVLLGGVESMAGPLVGGAGYTVLSDTLLALTQWWRAVLGAAILLLVLLFPRGLAGMAERR
jgi:branched-chain amino acid transport system permease protein